MKKILSVFLCLLMVFSCASALADGLKVGVSMPTKDLQRWNQDGENMKNMLEEAGFEVDLQFASNDVQQQLNQVTNMVNNGCKVVVISAVEGSSLGSALDLAKEKGVIVIAYDRLLMDSDAVSYYATFDNYMVGTKQGEYIRDTLDLDNAAGPFNLEVFTGDPGDNNAQFFYNGAMDVLNPYIDAGKLVIQSGQKDFATVATANWSTEEAQKRMENIISSYYADGTPIDVVLCSNDSTAMGVENALDSAYSGAWPIITGQDCDIAIMKNLIEGKQAMSVFKDTRTLAARVVTMVDALMKGTEPEVNDTETYNNGVKVVPSYLCGPTACTAENYKEILIDSGYYTEDQIK